MFLESSPVTFWSGEVKRPQIHPTAYIHHSAVLIGDVWVGKNVTIFPGVVIRADEGTPIIIGEGSNIQDGVIMHCLKGGSIEIGERCSIAHGAVIHGPCMLGRKTFIGFNTVLHNAWLGSNCFVSHRAIVINVHISNDSLIPAGIVIQLQDEAKELPLVGTGEIDFVNKVLIVNDELRMGYIKNKCLETYNHIVSSGYKSSVKD